MGESHASPISCDEAVRQLWDYLSGTISTGDHEEVEAHLAFCRRCCGELEFVEHLRALLAGQAADDLAPQEVRRLLRFVDEL